MDGGRRKVWAVGTAAAALAGLALAALDGSPDFLRDWLVYTPLLGLGFALLFAVSALLQAPRTAWIAALAAFGGRILIGALLFFLLPVAGHEENEATRAGYLFKDAYFRDREAWTLARSSDPLWEAFTAYEESPDSAEDGQSLKKYPSDQYGGMLALNAFVYRYISPDQARPLAVVLLGAAVSGVGVLFLWRVLRDWFGDGAALAGAWIFGLYPESVFLGSSQMREPWVIAGLALATFSLVQAQQRGRGWLAWAALSLGFLLFFQAPVALIALFVLGVAWFLKPEGKVRWKQVLVFAVVLAGVMGVVTAVWSSLPSLRDSSPLTLFAEWLQRNFDYQSFVTQRASGQVQNLLAIFGESARVLVFLVYGAARPVLPAALTDVTGGWLWYAINLARAAGWYLLAPLMIFATLKLFGRRQIERRGQLIWFAAVSWALVLIAAANGGADGWDNPRYRAIFLAWQALAAAWGWNLAKRTSDPWLGRLLWVEAAFVGLFTWWYLTRLPQLHAFHPSILVTAGLSLLAAAVILGVGWRRDREAKGKSQPIEG